MERTTRAQQRLWFSTWRI